eukprot:6021033-Prymnesium_polylepis.1
MVVERFDVDRLGCCARMWACACRNADMFPSSQTDLLNLLRARAVYRWGGGSAPFQPKYCRPIPDEPPTACLAVQLSYQESTDSSAPATLRPLRPRCRKEEGKSVNFRSASPERG